MADVKIAYATTAIVTITLTSLANSSARESTVIDNSSNKHLDAIANVICTTLASTGGSDQAIYIYAYGSVDGTANYTYPATGTDAAITLATPVNLPLIGVISCSVTAQTTWIKQISIASAFGGQLPMKYGIVVENKSAIAFTTTAANHSITIQPIYATVV